MSMVSSKLIGGQESHRKVRRKVQGSKRLNITSLTDVLTILLVFLIKNVSMEVQKVTVPQNMTLPTTITNNELAKRATTVTLKVFPDKILLGTDNINVGKLEDLVANEKTRKDLLEFLKDQSDRIRQADPQAEPCLLIQADRTILCQYITEIVSVGATSSFSNIYFSTIQGSEKTKVFGL